jgi:hypothetical protein
VAAVGGVGEIGGAGGAGSDVGGDEGEFAGLFDGVADGEVGVAAERQIFDVGGQPVRPWRRARLKMKGRKPTPWTMPRRWRRTRRVMLGSHS